MSKVTEMIEALRGKESLDNRKLLDDAARMIEALYNDIKISASNVSGGCLVCVHRYAPMGCDDYECDTCKLDCECRDCIDGSKWQWRAEG